MLLPSLSAANARDDHAGYSALLDWGLRLVLLLGLPAAVGMALLSDGLVATLFHYGAFAAGRGARGRDVLLGRPYRTAGREDPGPGFYARQDIRTPVKIAIGVLIVTQLLNLALVPLLAHAGSALAIGLGACLNALALLIGLLRRGVSPPRARLDPVRAAAAAGAGRAGGAAGLCRWPHRLDRAAGSCRPAGGLAGRRAGRQRRDLFRIVVPVRVPSPRLRTALRALIPGVFATSS